MGAIIACYFGCFEVDDELARPLLLFAGRRLINETTDEVVDLEVGDRKPGDERGYPDDDLKTLLLESGWKFVQKDGTPYA